MSSHKGVVMAISSLNTSNFIFLIAGLLLNWRPRRFLSAAARRPSVMGVLIQFPFMVVLQRCSPTPSTIKTVHWLTVLSHTFTPVTNTHTFAVIIGAYSAVLGLFIPSGGGSGSSKHPMYADRQ
jgi:short-chain fatty acids transporter